MCVAVYVAVCIVVYVAVCIAACVAACVAVRVAVRVAACHAVVFPYLASRLQAKKSDLLIIIMIMSFAQSTARDCCVCVLQCVCL